MLHSPVLEPSELNLSKPFAKKQYGGSVVTEPVVLVALVPGGTKPSSYPASVQSVMLRMLVRSAHAPHVTGQAAVTAAPCVAWTQYDASCVQPAGLPPIVKPVCVESCRSEVAQLPLERSAKRDAAGGDEGGAGGEADTREPQSVQSLPREHDENSAPRPPSSQSPSLA